MTLALPARHNAVHSPALRRATPWCAMRPLFCLQTLQATGPGTAPGRALTCAFPHSPRDGSLVAVGGENKLVTIWDASGDVSPGRLVATLTGFTQRVNATAFVLHNAASAASGSPCVASVASDGYLRIHSFEGEGGDDGRGGGALAGARLPLVEVSAHEEAANGVDATHDGAFLVTCSDDATLKVRAAPPVALPGLTCFAPSPGRPMHSATTHAHTQVWTSPHCVEVAQLDGHTARVATVACGPQYVDTPAAGGAPATYLVASGGNDGAVRLWHVRSSDGGDVTWRCAACLEGHSGWVLRVAFTPPSEDSPGTVRLVSASWDDTLRLWDPVTFACLRTLRHGCGVNAASFSADGGQFLATAGVDGTLRLWATQSGTQVASFRVKEETTALGQAPCHVISCGFAPGGWPCAAGAAGHLTLAAACTDGALRIFGYPPLYVWLKGLRLEQHYEALARHLSGMQAHLDSADDESVPPFDASVPLVPLSALDRVFEPDLEAVIGMSETEASRFVDHWAGLKATGYALPHGYVSPLEEVTAFVASFLGGPGEPPARLVVDRLGLATPEDTGALTPQEITSIGRCTPEAAFSLVAEAQRLGYVDACARRADAARRRQREAGRRGGILERCSPDGVTTALRALQAANAPPTASAFFISHCRAEAEDGALGLGEDLVAVSDDVIGHSIDEVWCGHQCFPNDPDTEAAMLNGVRGATAFLVYLTASTLQRPYCQLECRAARMLNKPLVVVHESDPAVGGADWHTCLAGAPPDLAQWLVRPDVTVLPHRVAPDQRRLLMADIFRSVRAQGGVFHALISISAHASLLAEVHALRGALAAEKALVLELGQSTLVTEIALLRTELEQETGATAVQRRRADELGESVRRLTETASQWEDQLGRALDREAEAQRSVQQLTEALEALQRASGEREQALQDSVATLGSDMSRLAGAVGTPGGAKAGGPGSAGLGAPGTALGGALTRVARYALAGLFQSIGGGAAVDGTTLQSFLSFLRCTPGEVAALVDAADGDGDGVVSAADWDAVTGEWLGGA